MWKHIIAGAALVGFILLVSHWRMEAGKVEGLEYDLKVQKEALRIQSEKFIAAKSLTQTVERNYETIIANRNSDISRLSKRPASCIRVRTTAQTSSIDGANQPGEPTNGTGISSAFLIDFAGAAETDRAKVIGLQDFINRLYKLYGE